MKKSYLLFIIPFLFAFQCEEEELTAGFESSYIIENNTSTTLYLLDVENRFREILPQSERAVNSVLNAETEPIPPAERLNSIRLYIMDGNDFIQVYTQDPVDDLLWDFSEPVQNRFEYRLDIQESTLN